MIVELNKTYIMTAPKQTQGMTQGPDEFVQFTSEDITYTHMNSIHNAKVEQNIITGLAKMFSHEGREMQVVMYVADYPINKAKKILNDTVEKYARVVKEAKKKK